MNIKLRCFVRKVYICVCGWFEYVYVGVVWSLVFDWVVEIVVGLLELVWFEGNYVYEIDWYLGYGSYGFIRWW